MDTMRLVWWHPPAIWRARHDPGTSRALLIWTLACVASVVSGPLFATWSGLQLRLGPFTLHVSLYPPLTICTLLALWAGPVWGIAPAFLTSFAIALNQGMPIATAAVFSLATPITLLVLWNLMVMLEVSPLLRTWPDLVRYVAISLVATGVSSVGTLVWNYHHHLRFSGAMAVWEGWVVGDFVQVTVIVGLLLRACTADVQSWLASRLPVAPQQSLHVRFHVAMFLLVLLIMLTVGGTAASLFLSSLTATGGGETIELTVVYGMLSNASHYGAFYALVVLVTVFLFASALGGRIQRQVHDIAERTRVHQEREALIIQLEEALSKVQFLSGLLPICAHCKKIRDDSGYWNQIETCIGAHSEAEFSHGICPDCLRRLYPDFTPEGETKL